ncbi:MAG TPA: protein-glutamate O-methyltransferase, partial [Acidobacteriaceae bacterium]|nr:protein-glutamate O-methyltransferase [Acidobacteriaceae bacterium]
TGIWLRDGKQVMLASRLSRRLRAHGLTNFADYYNYLDGLPDQGTELGELINCVTTNKTAFFREPHHFRFLGETVVPETMARMRGEGNGTGQSGSQYGSQYGIRIWSAACSTGEEPYSIAITLLEAQSRWHWPGTASAMRIVASDIDTSVLEKAARGIYAADEVEEMEPSLLKKHFLRGTDEMEGQVRVKKPVAALVEFERINLMDRSWPISGPFDAIFFRNALIYFRQETQDLFLRRMIRYLRPGGYLFLGHSEHIPWMQDVLEPLQQTIYRVRSAAR